MRKKVLGIRRYSADDQRHFATLSGDFNPVHLDATEARRTLFGEPVVHGMHTVLWALECYLTDRAIPFHLARLSATFAKPLFLGERVAAVLADDTPDAVHLQIAATDMVLIELKLRWADAASPVWASTSIAGDVPFAPKARSWQDLEDLAGTLPLVYDSGGLRATFPRCAEQFGVAFVAALAGLSRLVGMECPGLHSLFSSFEVEVVRDHDAAALHYCVAHLDRRVSALRMTVAGSGLAGTVNAFLRPPPVEQPSMETVAAAISPQEFLGQQALVVGGSRGLGEVTAKIIAVGGGHPVVTYRDGLADAERVCAEIRGWGAPCEIIRFDVARARGPLASLARRGWRPSHLYYFASPKIFVRRSRMFDDRLFRRFVAVYVEGFLRTYEACRALAHGPLAVFYPSSVAVEDRVRDLAEYAAAKAAGEALCRHLERFGRETRCLVQRLPRIRTDQTVSLLHAPAADALETMCDIARKLVTN